MSITLLQPEDIVRSETGINYCIVLSVFAEGKMAVIAPIESNGTYSRVGACAHQTAMLDLIERPEAVAEVNGSLA